jgi:microcystin degradation protein MlrC
MAGMLNAATELGYEKVGLLFAGTEPSGTIADLAYESLRDEIIERLKEAMPVSAVAVENHGAGVAESYECIEGDLAKRIRAVVGPDIPIVGTFDLHGNISPECVAQYNFMCPVHLYPHTDSYERGVEAMRMVPRLLSGLVTTAHLERVPTLLPLCMMCTQDGFPAAQMNEFMYSLEARPGVLDVSGARCRQHAHTHDLALAVSHHPCAFVRGHQSFMAFHGQIFPSWALRWS